MNLEATDSKERTDKLTVEQLCKEIEDRRAKKYAAKTKPYPRSNPIASDVSDCMRETVLGITNWKDRPEFSVGSLERAWARKRNITLTVYTHFIPKMQTDSSARFAAAIFSGLGHFKDTLEEKAANSSQKGA